MKFITDNYIIIIIVGLFFVFALIGYIIDMFRNNNEEPKEDIPKGIVPIEVTKIEEKEKKVQEKEQNNNPDELLENYNKEN